LVCLLLSSPVVCLRSWAALSPLPCPPGCGGRSFLQRRVTTRSGDLSPKGRARRSEVTVGYSMPVEKIRLETCWLNTDKPIPSPCAFDPAKEGKRSDPALSRSEKEGWQKAGCFGAELKSAFQHQPLRAPETLFPWCAVTAPTRHSPF